MDALELLDIVSSGETSKVQFKEKFPHQDSIAAEMVAMSNSLGGKILFGVEDKTGEIKGLKGEEIRDYSSRLGNISSDLVNPPVNVTTEVVSVENGDSKKVLIANIEEGTNKPYKDNNGTIWVKKTSDKRKLTDNNEILRLFQASSNLMADEMPVNQASIEDINEEKFKAYFEKLRNRTIEQEGLSYEKALHVKRVMLKGKISLGGLLFFGSNPQYFKTSFCIKAIHFVGNDLSGSDYKDSIDIEGTIPEMFDLGMKFFERNLKHVQAGQSFNSIGKLEISQIALEELLQNALLHRDYFKNAPIRLMIFDNRVEIVSPGKLPNGLTVEELPYSNPIPRNNILIGYAKDAMLFRGYGTGISRALSEQPNIELINDIEGEQFKVIIPREQ
ncbi:ATP-dependent DNA helicase RecG [Fulvivirga sp. M361]|nr:ATP-dependent DNA helicase RecG [Fulvivirga sp. M361]